MREASHPVACRALDPPRLQWTGIRRDVIQCLSYYRVGRHGNAFTDTATHTKSEYSLGSTQMLPATQTPGNSGVS